MREANRDLTFAGVIVVAPVEADEAVSVEQKILLDALHLRKIDHAPRDRVRARRRQTSVVHDAV